MKKQLLTRVLLAVLCLLVWGSNFAWADGVIMPTPIYIEDFESASITESAFSGANSTTGSLTGTGEIVAGTGAFGKYYQNQPASIGIRANFIKINTTAFQTASIATNKAVTLSFWVNTTYQFNNSITAPEWNAMFEAYTDAGFTANTASTEYVGSVARAFDIRANASSHAWFSNYEYHSTHNSSPAYVRNVSWITKGWHHIAYVLADNSGTTHLKFYIDGTLNTDVDLDHSGDGTLWANLTNITSYVLGGCAAEWADGDVAFGYDDIALYDAALTVDQVNQIIDTKKAINTIPSTFDFSTADAVSYQLNAPFDKGVVVAGSNVKGLRFGSSLNPATAYFDCDSEKDGRQPYNIDVNEAVIFSIKALHGYHSNNAYKAVVSLMNSANEELVSYEYKTNGQMITSVKIGGVDVDNFPEGGFSFGSSSNNGFSGNGKPYSSDANNHPNITITIYGDGKVEMLFTRSSGSISQPFTGTLGASVVKDLARLVVNDAIGDNDRAYAIRSLNIEHKYKYGIKAVDGDDHELATIETGLIPYGETANKYWSKYIKVDDNWYVTSSPYGKTISENDYEATPVYALSDIDYFMEVENMSTSRNYNSNTDYDSDYDKSSHGAATGVYASATVTAATAIPEGGSYTITSCGIVRNTSKSVNYSISYSTNGTDFTSTAKSISFTTGSTAGIGEEHSATSVTLPDNAYIRLTEATESNANDVLDYITLTKSPTNYTLKYVNAATGAELTTVTRQAKWGSVITLAEADKSVTVSEVDYSYISDDLDNTTVAADGTTIVTIRVSVPTDNPAGTITAAAGTSRKFTLSAADGSTIYYSETEKAIGDEGWLTYSSEVTTSATTIWAYATKTNYLASEVINFATGAGTTVGLNAPTISRTANNTVTITSAQGNVLGTPTATIYYRVGDTGDFAEYNTALNVTSANTVYAYTSATGYDNSTTASREVDFVANNVVLKERLTPTLGTGKTYTYGDELEGTSRFPVLVDGTQWGSNIYFQKPDPSVVDGGTGKGGWNFTTNRWYSNSSGANYGWVLFKDMKKDDVIAMEIEVAAAATVNATYLEKYSYTGFYAYVVNADGNVQLRMPRDGKGPNELTAIAQYTTTVSKTISSAGWATYCSPYILDFTGDITNLMDAYIVTGGAGGRLVTESVKGKMVPANTGLLLEGLGECVIPVAATSDEISGNKLVGVTSSTEIGAKTGYVLMNDATNGLGFYLNNKAFTVGANTAYLPANFAGIGARQFFSFGGETTSLSEELRVKSEEFATAPCYNLQGQRVNQPTKGLYIVDGKKMVIK